MAGRGAGPVPAARTTVPSNGYGSSPAQGPISSGLLINVIRTLTSSVSEEQRELEKKKLEKGYKESGEMIERLIKEHQGDIENCLTTFKDVSLRISTCRERIVNVRNALSTCKTLLECKRDDLKKLWMESSQQRHITDILNKLDELRNVPTEVELLTEQGEYAKAAQRISRAKAEMREVECIEGLSHVRVRLEETKDALTAHIMTSIVRAIVDEPFEKQLSDVVVGVSDDRIAATPLISQLSARLNGYAQAEPLAARINSDVCALETLDKDIRVLERMNHMSAAAIERQIRATISLIRLRSNTDETHPPDKLLLAQMMKVMVRQLEASRDAHVTLAERTRNSEVIKAFWRHSQTSIDCVVSDHTGLSSSSAKQPTTQGKRLFRFEATACASFASSSTNSRVICRPDVYNIVPIYPWLRHLISTIEESSGVKPCTLAHFVESVVMKNFMSTINADFNARLEHVMKSSQTAEALVEGSRRVYEMCSEKHHLLVNMEQYSGQLAALWLLVLSEYARHVKSIYQRATETKTDENGVTVCRRKISAAWAADDDISRLLQSLPNWILAHSSETDIVSPMAGIPSEREIRERNERESEILIGNLGAQTAIATSELMTNMEDVKRLAIIHDTMMTLAHKVRKLLDSIPRSIRTSLQSIRHRHELAGDSVEVHEGSPLELIERTVVQIESMSSTCLLMLHLELRVHCFYHLLPLSKQKPSVNDDVDMEVHDLGRDMTAFHKLLSEMLSQQKLNYIFDGLGHLCAVIFIHSSQHMTRLSDAGKKRVCRNIWGVQQRLSQLTGRREAQLDRARAFFDLLSNDIDRLLSLVPEKKTQFSPVELSLLVSLAVRSHPVLASQQGALDACLSQLNQNMRK